MSIYLIIFANLCLFVVTGIFLYELKRKKKTFETSMALMFACSAPFYGILLLASAFFGLLPIDYASNAGATVQQTREFLYTMTVVSGAFYLYAICAFVRSYLIANEKPSGKKSKKGKNT